MIGKQPPDTHIWILGGDAPAFIKSETLAFAGGPIWRIELTAPTWPRSCAAGREGNEAVNSRSQHPSSIGRLQSSNATHAEGSKPSSGLCSP